ncbi:MAG: type II toxin-antitoxin system RelE/ParE family toxin [Coriobacteriales bacterium]
MFKVTFYKRPNGNEPMTDHLDSLDIKMRVKVLRSLSILQEKGNELRYPETDDLGDGIFELRTSLGNNIERALFFFAGHREIVVTHGFIKKTRKTPRQEIDKAKRCRESHYRQKEKGL